MYYIKSHTVIQSTITALVVFKDVGILQYPAVQKIWSMHTGMVSILQRIPIFQST